MNHAELAAWLRLGLTPGVTRHTARRLLAAFGLPEAIFERSRAELSQVVPEAVAGALGAEPDGLHEQVARLEAWLASPPAGTGRRFVPLGDPLYPPGLLDTEDPPLALYLAGQVDAPWPRAIAMVGSRNPTAQGVDNARQFAAAFAGGGVTVVSGLALGVDAAAHEGALQGASAGMLATIAVVGTGLDVVYPKRNEALARRILERGIIASEYPLGTPPLQPNFPQRNRLISAFSAGTVVVEAALQSGSLITARLATEQGKEVFAIPGSIHSPQSRGCHALIKQGAKLVETAQDVLEELPALRGAAPRAPSPEHAAASPGRADDVLDALGFDPVGLDALIARTGLPASTLQARLLELELAGEVARLPGGLFQRRTAG